MFKPSKQQIDIFEQLKLPDCGSIIIDAKAGSGKTTTIVNAAKILKGDIFLGAFNKNMADELKHKCYGIPNTECATFHAIGYRVLRRYFPNIGNAKSNKVFQIVKYLNETEYGDDDYDKNAYHIAKIVSMAKMRGIGAIEENEISAWKDIIYHFGIDENLPNKYDADDELETLIGFCQHVLEFDMENLKQIDFDDMIYVPLLMDMELPKFDWVLIDEAQDTNPVRRELARRMLKENGRIIAVGDPHQAIYGFAGADNDAMDRIKKDFDAKVMPLSVTYRCGRNIVSVAQQYVPGIEAYANAGYGTVQEIDYTFIESMAKPGDVILSRFNKYLVSLCFMFIRKGISVKIEGRDIASSLVSLCKKWRTQDFGELTQYLMRWRDKEIKRAKEKGLDRADSINDRVDTLMIIISRAKELKLRTKDDMIAMIENLFDDNGVSNSMINLCSVHKAKGLEWDRVFLLGRKEIMGKIGKSEWQKQQEKNLIYVGVTRAKEVLFDVVNVPTKL